MKKLLLLCLLVPGLSFGQNLPIPLPKDIDAAIATTVQFESSVTLGITNLVSGTVPILMQLGWTLLAFFGAYALLQALLQSTLRSMAAHHYAPLAAVVAYVAVLFRIVAAAVMMTFYMIPLPGVSFNFHQMFPVLGNALSASITQTLLQQTLGYVNVALQNLPAVGLFSVWPAAVATIVIILLALGEVGMTVITSGSYAIVGMFTLCGPLMIPFYVLPGHDKKFWNWFDNMLVYSMYGFVGSGFIYIFCNAYLQFFTNMQGFSVGNWVAHIPMMIIITVVFLWTMFKVPQIAHMIFGGIGGVASGFASMVQSAVVLGIGKLLS